MTRKTFTASRCLRGVLLASVGIGAMAGACGAVAQQPPAAQQQQSGQDFAIAPKALSAALLDFTRITGIDLVYDGSIAANLASPGVSGTFPADQALARLLSGTGLVFRFSNPRTVVLSKAATDGAMTLDPVTVEAKVAVPPQADIGNLPPVYAGGQVARGAKLGMLGNRDMMDTPFNVTSYTAELVENQQARTLADVLENDPSVRFTTSGGHVQENYKIRGLSVSHNEMALNGMYGVAPNGHVPIEFLERVEVLKGPSALLSGLAPQGGVGGAVNLVTKKAEDTPITRISGDYASDAQFGTHVDVGRRFGTDDRVGVRFNGVFRDGDTGVRGQSKERDLGALALDYRGEAVRLSLDSYISKELNDGGSPMTVQFASTLRDVLAAPDSKTNILRGISGNQDNRAIMARAEYDITDNLTAHAVLGLLDYDYAGFITSTHAGNVNGAGTYTSGFTRRQQGYNDTLSAETGLRGRFHTAEIGHDVVVSATSMEIENGMSYRDSAAYVSNIYNPIIPPLALDPGPARKSDENHFTSLAVADTLAFLEEKILLTVGARHQRVSTRTFSTTTSAQTNNYTKSTVTPAVGLVVKPWSSLSFYGNYIEGLSPGQRVTDTLAANYGYSFAPFKSKQKEVGVKWDAGTLSNTVSLFEISKPSLSSNTVTHVHTQIEQRNRGLEWNVAGEVIKGVRALGGITYLQAEITKSVGNAQTGNTPFGTPTWQSNIGMEWDTPFVPGLTLEGRVVYTGEQYVNNTNTLKIDSWTRLDLGTRYLMQIRDQDVTIRANVSNVLGKDYWTGGFSDGYVTLSAPRTFMLSAAVDF